jgi:hypothetical protein
VAGFFGVATPTAVRPFPSALLLLSVTLKRAPPISS